MESAQLGKIFDQILNADEDMDVIDLLLMVGVDPSTSLVGADLRGIQIENRDFAHYTMAGANLLGGTLVKCNFHGAQLDRSIFSETSAEGCDFSGASLRDAQLDKGNFSHSSFCGATLRRAVLTGVTASYCDFSGTTLSGARLEHGNFEGASFRGAVLHDVLFSEDMELVNADFTGALGLTSDDVDRLQRRGAILDHRNTPYSHPFLDDEESYDLQHKEWMAYFRSSSRTGLERARGLSERSFESGQGGHGSGHPEDDSPVTGVTALWRVFQNNPLLGGLIALAVGVGISAALRHQRGESASGGDDAESEVAPVDDGTLARQPAGHGQAETSQAAADLAKGPDEDQPYRAHVPFP